MFLNCVVFATIGLFVGGAARLFYPGRQPGKIFGTLMLGMAGSLLGGLLSLTCWTVTEGKFHGGALLLSLCGAVLALALWAGVAYARARSISARA